MCIQRFVGCGTLAVFAVAVIGTAGRVAAGPNLLRNGDFTETDEKGMPKHWGLPSAGPGSGKSNVHTSLVRGPHGKPAVRIECTESATRKKPTWIILRQDGTVNARKGQKLYVSLWLKQENLEGGVINVWLMRLEPWGALFKASTQATREWQKVEFVFRLNETCGNTRFEIFFTQTGTLYLSDIHVAETTKHELDVNPIRQKMERERKPPAQKNMLHNGSFEAGIDGWGTEGFDHNVVKIDGTVSHHGKRSARIDLDKNSLPVGYSDYPKARKVVFTNVQLASSGWTRFEQGKQYTLSLSLKSNRKNLPAQIGVRFMTGAREEETLTVTDQWQRHALTFTARDIFGFVRIGSQTVDSLGQVWIDAVQLEKGNDATGFTSRYPVEIALHPKRAGGIYYTGEELCFDVASGFRNDTDRATVDLKALDYQENEVYQTAIELAKGTALKSIQLPVTGNGPYKLIAVVRGQGFAYTRQTHFVIIYPYARTYGNREARFGTNHPYYSDLLQGIARDAGVYWVRDWTLKWDNVEPAQGEWDFSGPEVFFDRARRFDTQLLTILPDPSSGWASSGPPESRGKRLGDAFEDLWYLPKDLEDYRRYVRKCIERYGGVSGAWEVLNEPYAGKTRNWQTDDSYDALLKIAKEEAGRVDKNLRVMRCGLGYFRRDQKLNADAARLADVLSEHAYPLYNNTRQFLRRVREMDGFLQRHGVKTDIWFTEYGKYSNDDPSYKHAAFDHYHANGDERTAAAYNIKYMVILFSHGVSKVFFHQRTWPLGLNDKGNRIHFDMLFDYGPRPHKLFPGVNALAWFLPPGTKPGRPVNEQGPIFAYSFDRPKDRVMIIWTDGADMKLEESPRQLTRGLAVYNMMGKQLDRLDRVGDEPVYLIGIDERIEALEKMLATRPACVSRASTISSQTEQIRQSVQKEIDGGLFPGSVVLVGRPEKVLYHEAFGHARVVPDKVEMRKDSIFGLASITKVVATGTAFGVCVDEGLLDFDTPIREALADLTGKGIEKITVQHLATHTSGFSNAKYHERAQGEEMLELMLGASPRWAAGSRYEYSCLNMILLGRIVERATGKRLDVFCRERLFQPLGMHDTAFGPMEPSLRIVPSGSPGIGQIEDTQARVARRPVGNAGLFSTAADLARFCQMMLGGGQLGDVRILSERSHAWMTRNLLAAPLPARGFCWDMDLRTSHRPKRLSEKAYGHSGHTGQSIWIDPEKMVYVIVLTNRDHPKMVGGARKVEQYRARGRIADAALEALGY